MNNIQWLLDMVMAILCIVTYTVSIYQGNPNDWILICLLWVINAHIRIME